MTPSSNTPDEPCEADPLVAAIHASPMRGVVAITGGGSGAIGRLLGAPGASATLLEAVVPYAAAALAEFLGGEPDQACNARTARAMAIRAFERARQLDVKLPSDPGRPHELVGVGSTASLATNRPKRGEHRLHAAAQTSRRTVVVSLTLEKGRRSRAEEEAIAERTVLAVLAEAAGARPIDLSKTPPGIEAAIDSFDAPPEWTELLLGQRDTVAVGGPVEGEVCLLPGSFNPPHEGHHQIAAIASEKTGRPVVYELSITNVEKPPLDFIELRDRLAAIDAPRILLTRAPRFVEKARLKPGCVFAVGADTIARIGDPRYYADAAAQRDAAIAELARHGCRFLVFGREAGGAFTPLEAIDLPPALRKLCDGVAEAEFRVDRSSTELRRE